MRRLGYLFITLAMVTAAVLHGFPSQQIKGLAGIRLRDVNGNDWTFNDVKDAKAVVVLFLGTQCPINNAYVPRLLELHQAYAPKGVFFVAVNSNKHDTEDAIRAHTQKFQIPFPVLKDDAQRFADLLGAERVPEAFVLDSKWHIRYQGRIDDQFGIGYQRPQPTKQFVMAALDAVLAGAKVSEPKVAVEGCYITREPRARIKRNAEAAVTYNQHVAPILQQRCQECHRPGQIGPMPLLTYDDAASWAQMIEEVVSDGRMPPWHADPKHGKFVNDRRLSAADKETLLTWIKQGCPEGAGTPPPTKQWVEGWNIGEPDMVFTMPNEYTVPAKAPKRGIPYRYFHVATNFEEDRWIQAVEAKPGNPSVVHHIIVYVVVGKKRFGESFSDGVGSGLLVAYAPGDMGAVYPAGSAKKIPKGAHLVFQMHYTPNGVEQTDRSSVGLIFSKEPPQHEVRTRAIAQQLFLIIQPELDNQRFKSASTFSKDTLIWNLMPHMHLRGKSFEYEAVYPDGKRETILSVPRYDFGWQASYRLAQPLRLPAGSRIECTALFDNSVNNPNNPDPSKTVRWGDQTWEEMMIGFVDYTTLDK